MKEPKTCSLELYTNIWVKQELANNLATKSVKPISIDKPPASFKASVDYFSVIPYEQHAVLRNKFLNAPLEKRREVWDNFNLPIKKIEKHFALMTLERNKFAINKGYQSRIDMFIHDYKIPIADYDNFIKNIDKVINYCNQQLPKIDNLPNWFYSVFGSRCFVCLLPSFPFKTLDETLKYATHENKILNKFRNKIIVTFGDSSKIRYKKETDDFEITIEKNENIRHKSTDLIHELSHTINYFNHFKNDKNPFEKGKYLNEKEALKTELGILKKLSPHLYQSMFSQYLSVFHSILFQIELDKNPKQDLSKLYADTFNRCFKKAKQKSNPLYILDDRITLHPFSSLHHAVAYFEVIKHESSLNLKEINVGKI